MPHPGPDNLSISAREEAVRILYVDDDRILAEFAKVHLETPTTTVESAFNGADAWERLCRGAYDIVLLDIEMPTLDGFGLLQKLRADSRFENLPVVMLTGREDIAAIDRAFQLGANSFITKPINWRQLAYALRYVLRTTRMETDLLRERKRSGELLQLTNNLLSLIKLEARTPLGAIIGFSDCIRQQIDGPVGVESYLGYAEQIGAAARQLQDRFLDLIQYAQLASGAAKLSEDEYPASKVMDAAIAGLSSAPARGRVDIDVRKPAENFYLLCDLQWLARALRHLLEFALNGAGVDRVEFSMALAPSGAARATITVHRAARTSAGTAEALSGTTSLESVRQGMGVGIPFARCIAELHDGALAIGARDDFSTTMEITLPARRVLGLAGKSNSVEAA